MSGTGLRIRDQKKPTRKKKKPFRTQTVKIPVCLQFLKLWHASSHLKGLKKADCVTSKCLNQLVWGGAQEFPFPVISQVLLVL